MLAVPFLRKLYPLVPRSSAAIVERRSQLVLVFAAICASLNRDSHRFSKLLMVDILP